MKSLNLIKEALDGKRIVKLYRTKNPERTMWHEDGLGELKWYKLVIEIENDSKFILGEDEIERWNENRQLVEIEHENKDKLESSKIVDFIMDEAYKGIYLKLQNDYVIYHDTFFGSEFIIEKYEEVFDETGKLK